MMEFSKTVKVEIISDEMMAVPKVEPSEPKSKSDTKSELGTSSSKCPLKRTPKTPSADLSIYNKVILLKTLKDTNCNPKCKSVLKKNFRKKMDLNDVQSKLKLKIST